MRYTKLPALIEKYSKDEEFLCLIKEGTKKQLSEYTGLYIGPNHSPFMKLITYFVGCIRMLPFIWIESLIGLKRMDSYSRFIFFSDCHITTSAPFRVGDPLQDIISKLEYVIEQANSYDALILIGGDVFDKPTIPYEAYTAVCEVFKKAKYTPIAIKGNHDQLFRCDDNDKKTTIYNAFKLGVLRELKSPMDVCSCVLTPDKSLINRDKPQILVYHGFLNVKDGKHTLYPEDFAGVTTPTLILLGHDHVKYDPVRVGSVEIHRPGSLFRNRRDTSSDRVPCLLYIEVKDGGFKVEYVDIPSRSVNEIFKEHVIKSQQSESGDYCELIKALASTSSEDMDLSTVIAKVAPPTVGEYLQKALNEIKVQKIK